MWKIPGFEQKFVPNFSCAMSLLVHEYTIYASNQSITSARIYGQFLSPSPETWVRSA